MSLNKTKIITAVCIWALFLVIAPSSYCSDGDESSRKEITRQRGPEVETRVPFYVASGSSVYSPEKVGELALVYGSKENTTADKSLFLKAVDWLEKGFVDNGGVRICAEHAAGENADSKGFQDGLYCQATGVLAFIEAFRETGDKKYLALAKDAAKPFASDISEKGFMYRINGLTWFDDPSYPDAEPGLLKGHMRTLVALERLYKASGDTAFKDLFASGLKAVRERMSLYDSGYWLSNSLERNREILLRFSNPYGFMVYPLAIEKISLNDSVSGFSRTLDLSSGAGSGIQLAGHGWQAPKKGEEARFRRLKSQEPLSLLDEITEKAERVQGAFVRIDLAGYKKGSNPLYLEIIYRDETAANINIQIQSIAPGQPFRDLPGGDLTLTGSGNKQRKWTISVWPQQFVLFTDSETEKAIAEDLGFVCNTSRDESICAWEKIVRGYITSNFLGDESLRMFGPSTPDQAELPEQTPFTGYLLNPEGIVLCRNKNGAFINPFEVARASYDDHFIENVVGSLKEEAPENLTKDLIKKNNLDYLKKTAKCSGEACLWTYEFDNSYNDITTTAPWSSAFAQSYVIEAFLRNTGPGLLDYAKKAANAYAVPTSNGGLLFSSKEGIPWFEEVPNNTHILNAHIVSTNTLHDLGKASGRDEYAAMYGKGADSLARSIQKFDNGYWTRYDLNPKKELMFQIDWVSGPASPLIDEICVLDPLSAQKNCVDAGEDGDFDGKVNRLSGLDWGQAQKIDGRTARPFLNGYAKRDEAPAGGALHNVFFTLGLPANELPDFFDIQDHYLFIRYKDTGDGEFIIKTRSIREGNFLEFVPLYNGYIKTTGDMEWKYAVVKLRPQDLGWYVGVDYLKYHIEQLDRLAKKSGNPILAQYSERWKDYLAMYASGKSPIAEPRRVVYREVTGLKVVPGFKLYDGHGFENALDGDSHDDYVASVEGQPLPYVFEVSLPSKKKIRSILLAWESQENSGSDFTIEGYNGRKRAVRKVIKGNTGRANTIVLDGAVMDRIKVTITSFNGQQRLLMRQLELISEE